MENEQLERVVWDLAQRLAQVEAKQEELRLRRVQVPSWVAIVSSVVMGIVIFIANMLANAWVSP